MTEQESVTIHQVENGYILTEFIRPDSAYATRNEFVFQTFSELILFLEAHFSYRCKIIETDKDD